MHSGLLSMDSGIAVSTVLFFPSLLTSVIELILYEVGHAKDHYTIKNSGGKGLDIQHSSLEGSKTLDLVVSYASLSDINLDMFEDKKILVGT